MLFEKERGKKGCEHRNGGSNHTGCGSRDGGHGNIEENLVQEEAKRPKYQEQGNVTPAWQSDAFEKPDGKQEQGG
ncbi:hypothetical protein SDC9_99651 [bioreactor metagenome]|uniref:Uncharacterized protein n=1 Tax=bioreactor metagenome TaxID=1076179 RepID=A0A645AIP1_9ZZZZ